MEYRIGYAEDIHKLVPNRKLILGGIEIPYSLGLLGYSDADVVLHAVAESILGALSLGDLGTNFPDSDPKYKGIDSKILLNLVFEMMNKKGFEINNIDISISLEEPKLKQYIGLMKEIIATILKTQIEHISIKAMTNEGLDSVGKKEACRAISIVMLRR
jgi:2-C-methyl-D-erythritol 2,4-cyclodiphosphate synthase